MPWEALKVSMEEQVATVPTPVRADASHAGPDDDTIPADLSPPWSPRKLASQPCESPGDSQGMDGCGHNHEAAKANDHDVSC